MGRAAALGASTALISTMIASVDALAAETVKKGGLLRLGLAGGSTTDSFDITTYTDSVMIDASHGVFNRARRMGRGRQAEAGTGVKLGAQEWRCRVGLQPAQGRQVLERQGIHCGRCDLFVEPAPRGEQVRRGRVGKSHHRRQEARQDTRFRSRLPPPTRTFPM